MNIRMCKYIKSLIIWSKIVCIPNGFLLKYLKTKYEMIKNIIAMTLLSACKSISSFSIFFYLGLSHYNYDVTRMLRSMKSNN